MNRIAIPLAAALFLLAPAADAQTLYAFGASLSGANEVPPNASTGTGIVGVVYIDNPSPAPDAIVVRGGFAGLSADYTGSHLHDAPAGQNGPIVQGLTATLDPDNRGGEWEEASNTYFVPPFGTLLDDLQAGTIYVNVHSTAFPGGELRGQLAPVPLLDGDLSDPLYQTLATKLNGNGGFGPDIDVREIVYYADVQNEVLFLGIKGELNTASGDGIGLWLDFSELDGAPAGTALGGVTNAGHFMGASGNPNYTADFEVDYAFAINPGGGTSSVFFDATKYVGTVQADYLGSTDQSGTVAIGPPDDVDNTGGPAFFRAVAFAFDNSGGPNTGLEFAIPFSELGITGAGTLSAFAFVVSNSAYFSDVTVPGNVTAGNLGFDPDFDANVTSAGCNCPNPSAPIGTGPYHATASLSGDDCEQALSATLDNQSPSPGDVITFSVTVTNNGASAAPLDLWLDATGPASRRLRLASGTLPAGATVTRSVRVRIPGNAPSGTYNLDLNIGNFAANEICDTVAFTLNVQPARVGAAAGATDFEVLDDFFAAEATLAGQAVVVSPNPFVGQAAIRFEVAEAADVRLVVYDVRGRAVAVLLDGRAEAGVHEATFDAAALPSGVYVYRLQVADPVRGTGTRVETGRLTVLR